TPDGSGTVNDGADVVVDKQCADVPTYRCDALTVTKIGERKYSYKVDYTATNGAAFKNVRYDFGDGNTLLTDKTTVEHTYAKAGSYATKATVTFTVNGREQTSTNDDCAKVINVDVTP